MANGPLSHDYVDFFSQLARTNTKPWFEANKARFLEQVKQPFESLVGQLLSGAAVIDGIKPIPVPDSVFRIHRDTRFGKDTIARCSRSTPGWRAVRKGPGADA